MAVIIGEKKRASRNNTAVTADVKPVRPPSATPEALSTNVVVVEVPSMAPAVVATASAISAPLMRGSFPSLSRYPAFVETPISVPRVSKRSTNRNENTTVTNSSENIFEKSNLKNIGDNEGGIATTPPGRREYAPASGSTT